MRKASWVLGLTVAAAANAALAGVQAPERRYADMVARVANLANDGAAQALAGRHDLNLVNVMWEDTGRYQGSSVGPNISDVTIEVEIDDRGQKRTSLMPVLRHPNFSDKTGDVAIERVMLPVGNQQVGKNSQLTYVSLREFLSAPGRYLTLPQRGTVRGGSLLAPERDSHALVSAQATFLPVPATGSATFWPVIFNYQSTPKDPAVLTLLVTRQGTSVTVVDNARDTVNGGFGDSWGQRLFFNKHGERAPLTAERLSAVQASGTTANGEDAASLGADANLLMIIQVPLKTRPRPRKKAAYDTFGGIGMAAPAAAPMMEAESASRGASDVEVAVLGHGPVLGPYTELDDLTIERDARFPVRVTVQFYQATSNGVVSAKDMKLLAAQVDKVYDRADYVGSLVVPTPADTRRPTNWSGVGPMPPGTRCASFPALVLRGLCRPQHEVAGIR